VVVVPSISMAAFTVLSSDVVQAFISPAIGGCWHLIRVSSTCAASAEPGEMWNVDRTSLRFSKGTLSAMSCGRMGVSASAGKERVMVLPGCSWASWKKMLVSATVPGSQKVLNSVHLLILGCAE